MLSRFGRFESQVMNRAGNSTKQAARKLPMLLAAAGLALGAPTAGLAYVALSGDVQQADNSNIGIFTPASVEPGLALRVAQQSFDSKVRFTPAGTTAKRERTVTVAVRVDGDTARAITFRSAIEGVGAGEGLSGLAPTRYNLGTARGYKSFARPNLTQALATPEGVRSIEMPDLATFTPSEGTAADKPGRFQPRIALEPNGKAGRAPNTLEALGSQSVDLGGAYRVTRNLNVTAGVRLSQERDRLTPLTDAQQDSQAVYVGTQFRF